jgi:hypothetical protein
MGKKGEVYRWILKSKRVGIRKGEKEDCDLMYVVQRNTMHIYYTYRIYLDCYMRYIIREQNFTER